MHLADEILDHVLGDFEIGDDAVAQGTDGLDVAGGSAQHLLGVLAHGQHLFLALDVGDGDHRRLVEDNVLALYINQRVGGTEIDRHIGGENSKNSRQHMVMAPVVTVFPIRWSGMRPEIRGLARCRIPHRSVRRTYRRRADQYIFLHQASAGCHAESADGAVFSLFTKSLLRALI